MLKTFYQYVGRAMTDEDEPIMSGLVIISAPPNGGGLSTLYSCSLKETDRYMRDFVSIQDSSNLEAEVENVEVVTYNRALGESAEGILPSVLLKQPDVLVIPNIASKEALDVLIEQVLTEDRMTFVTVNAKDCAEALLRIAQLRPNMSQFAEATTMVLNQRLVRKLCTDCKQAYPPNPQLVQKLGLPPGRVSVFYREWQPPPPGEEPKKKKGEPDVCPTCNGGGYFERTGIFEMMLMNDHIRQALVQQPKLDVIRQISRKTGNRSLQEEAILLVAKGVTSINEIQRVMKQ